MGPSRRRRKKNRKEKKLRISTSDNPENGVNVSGRRDARARP
jgi:hypothetical protein